MEKREIKLLYTTIVITETKVYVENEEPIVALNCLIMRSGGKAVILENETLDSIKDKTDREVILMMFEVNDVLDNYITEIITDILRISPMYKTTCDFKESRAHRLMAYMIDGNRELIDEFVDKYAYGDLMERINEYIINKISNYSIIKGELEDIIYELYNDNFVQDMIDNTFDGLTN